MRCPVCNEIVENYKVEVDIECKCCGALLQVFMERWGLMVRIKCRTWRSMEWEEKRQAEKHKENAMWLRTVARDFPDLRDDGDCIVSNRVNTLANECHIVQNPDTIYAYPYVLVHDRRVYSFPSSFLIGSHNDGVLQEFDWKKVMRDYSINENVISIVENYITKLKQKRARS